MLVILYIVTFNKNVNNLFKSTYNQKAITNIMLLNCDYLNQFKKYLKLESSCSLVMLDEAEIFSHLMKLK
jgi:hypothetical protein